MEDWQFIYVSNRKKMKIAAKNEAAVMTKGGITRNACICKKYFTPNTFLSIFSEILLDIINNPLNDLLQKIRFSRGASINHLQGAESEACHD